MKLAGNIAVRELFRNKYRLVIACIISLILFLSAFILINLSLALPDNFYNFYQDNYGDDMAITINNADEKLYSNSSEFFESIKLNYEFINEKFTVNRYSKNSAPFNYIQPENVGGTTVSRRYMAGYTDHYPVDSFIDKFGEDALTAGGYWDGDDIRNMIWIADIVADRIGVKYDDYNTSLITVSYDLEDTPNVIPEYKFRLAGIYSYDKVAKKQTNFPVYLISGGTASNIYLNFYDKYSVSGTVADVSRLYHVYNELSKIYEVEDSLVTDMIITVKNSEVICAIIGYSMLIGGLIVLMNFIGMFISTNRKNIGLMLALGAKPFSIALGYAYIYLAILVIMFLISLCVLPAINMIIEAFCVAMGYTFTISINYWAMLALFALCNIIMFFIMLGEEQYIKKLSPNNVLKEED